ncbi:MAG: hypothetical protein QMD09_12550 [Desulfatibacillaceae bacterium]|nr:hypothetical protein [Desulfatibacillaceae bacterium]
MDDTNFKNIAVLESEIEARLLEAILEEKGIVFDMMSYGEVAYDGLFQFQKGWGVVRAAEKDEERIKLILADIRSPDAVTEPPPGLELDPKEEA